MNRRIFLHLSGPAALIGVLLFAAAVGSVWTIQRLQRNLTSILAENVTSLEAAQELEINLRRLRFASFMNLLQPRAERARAIAESHRDFETALAIARRHASTDREAEVVEQIEAGYRRYRKELEEGPRPTSRNLDDYVAWANQHPIQHLHAPCEELLTINKSAMAETARESETVGRQTRMAILALGILGPISGLIVGAIVARAWSRSIARLSVRLHDVHAQLRSDSLNDGPMGDGEGEQMTVELQQDWTGLDRQLDRVVERVKDAAAQIQRQQTEILRTEQLAAVGKLAANVAHEIRNPLTSVKLLVGMALRPGQGESLTKQDLGVIHDEVVKVEQTVQGLLDFAKPPKVHRQDADLRAIVEQAISLVRPKAEQHHVRVSLHADSGVPCRVDASQMGHVVVNLLMNALDAMPEGGEIDVTLQRKGAEVSLMVADNGPGVAPEIAPRLFEPFASTKLTGTGLGLSICRRIVRDHHGTIVHLPRPGGGSSFLITLAMSDETSPEVPDAALAGR